MSDKYPKHQNASLQKALKGDYEFDVRAVFDEGWKITQKDKWAMLQGLIVVMVIALLIVELARTLSAQQMLDFNASNVRMATELVIMICVAPLAAGLMMMGINGSIGGKNKTSDLFHFVHRSLSIIVLSMLISVIVQLGLLLFILPGLYLIIATGFAMPLMLDKGILPARAVVISVKVVNGQWRKFVALYAVFAAMMVLAVLTFGIALIWLAPLYYNVKGILYRDIFGVGAEHQVLYPVEQESGQDASQSRSKDLNKDDIFDA